MFYTKMHGAGNDFIIINNIVENFPKERFSILAETLCRRKVSIGADGLMIVERPEDGGDFKMIFYNSDGSPGEMCGNGARCIARYGHDNGLSGDVQRIETTAGMVTGERVDESYYRVRLNDLSVLQTDKDISIDEKYADILKDIKSISYAEMGNPGLPHAVVLMDDSFDINPDGLKEFGSYLRHHKAFPKGANVNFTKIIKDEQGKAGALEFTFERGVEDFTLACGTGAGCITAVLKEKGLVDGKKTMVKTMGGDLFVTIDGGIFLTGHTCIVATGNISDEIIKKVI